MSVAKKISFVTLLLWLTVALSTLSLVGCGNGDDDDDAFDAYDLNIWPECDENSNVMPRRIQFSDDGLRLVAGLGAQDELYGFSTDDDSDIKRIDLTFEQSDWWTQLNNNYTSETNLLATMAYDGVELESPVGVRFKGFTSYQWNNTQKKSFNISMDYLDHDQDINGYDTLNLHCAWGDNTFMREVIYEHINQRYIPAVSVNYVELYINGEYWGIYINSQQLDNNFINEWFTSTNGTRWRAEVMGGVADTDDGPPADDFPEPAEAAPPGAPPGGMGIGGSALNYLGDSPDDYTPYYDLQKYCWSDPWDDLINVCFALENTSPEAMETEISKYLDLDRTLWFLIMEIVFADEDSYVNKGAMDFYLYWDDTTGRVIPLEYDGNSTLLSTLEMGGAMPGAPPGGGESFLEWTPFHKTDDPNYPLLYKLLNVPSIRQHYLAHMRTVLNESFNETDMTTMIDAYASKIGPYISSDPKTFITDFAAGVDELKNAVSTRLDNLWSNEELNVTGLGISDVKWVVGTDEFATPLSSDAVDVVIINATVEDIENGGGIESVYAYVGQGIKGTFVKVQMFDDGAHEDGPAGDGIYGVALTEEAPGVRTRFYIEAVAGDAPGTRTYYPSRAAHDVFTFQVDGN